jgi:hypothetical protein
MIEIATSRSWNGWTMPRNSWMTGAMMAPKKCSFCPWGVTGTCQSLYVPDERRPGRVKPNILYGKLVSYVAACTHWRTGERHLFQAAVRFTDLQHFHAKARGSA